MNLQVLAIEMFKIKNNIAQEFLNEIFQNRALPYNLMINSSSLVDKYTQCIMVHNRYNFLDQRYGN